MRSVKCSKADKDGVCGRLGAVCIIRLPGLLLLLPIYTTNTTYTTSASLHCQFHTTSIATSPTIHRPVS